MSQIPSDNFQSGDLEIFLFKNKDGIRSLLPPQFKSHMGALSSNSLFFFLDFDVRVCKLTQILFFSRLFYVRKMPREIGPSSSFLENVVHLDNFDCIDGVASG